jgi:hypothetical protein
MGEKILEAGQMVLGNETDLTTPTATQDGTLKLGQILEINDSTLKSLKKYMYVKASGALSKYGVYIIRYGGTAGAEVVATLSIDTSSAPLKDVYWQSIPCVAEVAFTDTYYGWVCIQGTTTVATVGSVTDQHACKLGDAVATVATEGAVTVTIYTVGINRATRSGAGNTAFELIGCGKEAVQYTAS